MVLGFEARSSNIKTNSLLRPRISGELLQLFEDRSGQGSSPPGTGALQCYFELAGRQQGKAMNFYKGVSEKGHLFPHA